jgi:hypothetical protein
MAKGKNGNTVRLPQGNFASKKDVKPAVFSSKPDNYSAVVESAVRGEKLGEKINFGPDGLYKTKDQKEIDFLKAKTKRPGPVSEVTLERDVQLKDELKKIKKGKGD